MSFESGSREQQPEPETGIAFNISALANRLLTTAAKRSERAKKREAKLRLEDHLKRFPNWQPSE